MKTVGLLALQGAAHLHADVLRSLDLEPREVRRPEHLDGIDALVLPGGESTTISMLLESSGLSEPVRELIAGGLPTLATCAGVIVVAREVHGGRADQVPLGLLDAVVVRNAYGRQVDSFEAALDVEGLDEPFDAVFIRAPAIAEAGADVEVLATHRGAPVLVRQGALLAATFHPELSGDDRLHRAALLDA